MSLPTNASQGVVDVVIPACNEEADLPACLLSLLAQNEIARINIIVVANGCSDRTAEIAGDFRPAAEAAGHRLSLVEIPRPGKAHAINAADPLLAGDIHVYLDADVVLSSGALAGLSRALAPQFGPRIASPCPMPLIPAGWAARGYAEAWMQLPSVANQVTGNGCYAVNSAGRRRWSAIPEIVADDAFVRARFRSDERVLLSREYFVYAFPSGRDLLGVLARWRNGNRELASLNCGDDPSSPRGAALMALASRPAVWRHIPAFAAVSLAVRLRHRGLTSWFHASRRQVPPPSLAPRLAVVVVRQGSSDGVGVCLDSLNAALVDTCAEITVVDNGSQDGIDDLMASRFPAVALMENPQRVGIAAVVNRSVLGQAGDFVLLVAEEIVVDDRAVELLLLVARRFPWAGVYSGQARRGSEAAHVIRETTTGCGALLLIRGDVWEALGGLEEHTAHAQLPADFCARARSHGYAPLHVTAAEFTEVGDYSRVA